MGIARQGQASPHSRPWAADRQTMTSGWGLVAAERLGPVDRRVTRGPVGLFSFFLNLFFFLSSTFCASGQLLLVGSNTCPALPRLFLETSNTHNVWSVGPKTTIFFPQSLLGDASSQKVSKNLKTMWAQVTQTKIGLSAVRTFSPLGVKNLWFLILFN
jgi:hypothetical protein